MNKVFNVNLGGYPFTIDEDAFSHLNKYLQTIDRHFQQSEGYEEIVGDIEARIAELFQESLNGRSIVTLKDVKEAIEIMGTPEEFGADPIQEAETVGHNKSDYKTGKRFFRNPDNQLIGGVCSGLAAYFGIQDPIWVRIAFCLIALTAGFGIPMYIILWIIVPEAESASDRLAMQGKPINVSNIGKIVEEEFEHFSKKMSELGEGLQSKKKILREKIRRVKPFPKGFL